MGEAEDPGDLDSKSRCTLLFLVIQLLRRYHEALCFQQLKALIASSKSDFLFNVVDLYIMGVWGRGLERSTSAQDIFNHICPREKKNVLVFSDICLAQGD